MEIHQVQCADCGMTLQGQFEISPLAHLAPEDQLFLTAFLRYHGSLKKMEELFDISYPTVKNRLNHLAAKLDAQFHVRTPEIEVLEQLESGEIDADKALELLR
tara:strand:+ start:3458 stop:3766 length:309 start_codon:yes stop_codon:yes gene_type:complete